MKIVDSVKSLISDSTSGHVTLKCKLVIDVNDKILLVDSEQLLDDAILIEGKGLLDLLDPYLICCLGIPKVIYCHEVIVTGFFKACKFSRVASIEIFHRSKSLGFLELENE